MKKQSWIFLFGLVLAADITGILLQQELIETISKSLLMPVLLGYFIMHSRELATTLKNWIIGALLFSWLGDVLLIFQGRDSIFFLLGLSAFLLAHICYIIFFHKTRLREKIPFHPWLLGIVIIYYAALISWLSPRLGDMKWPVYIYGIVISTMLMLALHMYRIKDRNPKATGTGLLLIAGAVLFVVSDSVLAINKFYQSFEAAPVLIMLTYGLAQWLLTEGALRYGQTSSSR